MKNWLIVIFIIIVSLVIKKYNNEKEVIIPSDSIRLRVISNSNSEFDIISKLNLKDYLENYLFDLIKDAQSKEEVDEIIVNNLDDLNIKVAKFLNSNNYKIDYGQNYFPSKVYKGVVYNEGIYDSLVITLGNGKGSNWWCVLFPPLCLIEDNKTTTDVEYRFFVSRIIDELK